MEKDFDREEIELAREKEDGFYQPAADTRAEAATREKGNMAIGAIYALIGSMVAFIVAGYFLDRFFETVWYFTVGGVLLGTVTGFYQFIRISGKNN
jgi:F0F1-type ATP synthase assembly protein I